MVKIKGVVAKKQLRDWLENWLSFTVGDLIPDAPAGNSGAKSRDGVTGGQINKIMLDEAVSRLPIHLRRVIYLRWTAPRKVTLREALRELGIQKSEYYRRCDAAIDRLYDLINGLVVNYARLYINIH